MGKANGSFRQGPLPCQGEGGGEGMRGLLLGVSTIMWAPRGQGPMLVPAGSSHELPFFQCTLGSM
jgi:hypothetical protein